MKDLVYLGTTDGLLVCEIEGREVTRRTQGLHGRFITSLAWVGDALLVAILAHGVCRVRQQDLSYEWALEADILSLASHPGEPGVSLAGAEPASVYRTDDGGQTWQELKALRQSPDAGHWYHPSPTGRAHVLALAFDPHDPRIFYVGIEVGGVFKTCDGGEDFAPASHGLYPDVHRLVAHPGRSGVLFAVTGQGVYKTEDGAATWRPCSRGLTRRYATAAGIVSGPLEAVVVGAAGGPPWNAPYGANAMLFRSNSGGDAWQTAMDGLPSSLDGAPVGFAASSGYPGRLYCGVASGELLMSENGGRSWHLVAGDQPSIQAILCVSPTS